jgi:hypothetical protein
MRPELHVDTEQRQYFDPSWIGLRHIEQTANGAMGGESSTNATPANGEPAADRPPRGASGGAAPNL